MISQNLDDFEFRALWTVNKSSQFYEKTTKENKMSTCKLWKIRFKMLRGDCDSCLDDCCEENTNLVTSDDFIDSLVSIWIDFVQKFREIMSKHFRQKFIDFTKFFKSFLVFVTFCTLYSVDISWFLYHSNFTWNQFGGFKECKICHFNTFRGSEFWFLRIFALFEGWHLPNEQNSQPLKWQKRQFLYF